MAKEIETGDEGFLEALGDAASAMDKALEEEGHLLAREFFRELGHNECILCGTSEWTAATYGHSNGSGLVADFIKITCTECGLVTLIDMDSVLDNWCTSDEE